MMLKISSCVLFFAVFFTVFFANADTARVLPDGEADGDVGVETEYEESPLEAVVSDIIRLLPAEKIRIARRLIDAGADVNKRDRIGRTLLMRTQNPELVKLLLDAGTEVNAKDDKGRTALAHAESVELMKLLLDAGADVNAKDNEGRTLISYGGKGEHIRLLLVCGADGEDLWRWGNPLFCVADIAAVNTVLDLLRAGGQDVKKLLNQRDKDGNTPLMHAVEQRRELFGTRQIFRDAIPEMDLQKTDYAWRLQRDGLQAVLWEVESEDMLALARAFTAAGADVNLVNNEGRTPIFYTRKPETVRVLLEAGAKVNVADKQKQTPLHSMIQNDAAVEAVRLVIEAGADVNARNQLGWSPLLTLAVNSDSLQSDVPATTRLLLEAGANPDARPYREGDPEYEAIEYTGDANRENFPNWFTPLHRMRDEVAVQALLAAGANIEARTEDDKTPLHMQASWPLVAKTLIAGGADVNARDMRGQTPLFYAHAPRVIRMLAAAGADVNARDDWEQTPIFLHLLRDSSASVEALIAAGADVNARDSGGQSVLTVANYYQEIKEILITAGAVEEEEDEDDVFDF